MSRERRVIWLGLLAIGLAVRARECAVALADPPAPPWTARDLGRGANDQSRSPAANGTAPAPSAVDVDLRGLWMIRTENPPASPRADSFFLISQPFTGEGSVVALLLGLADQTGESGVGVTIRESDAPGARHVLFGMSAGRGPFLRYRSAARKNEVLAR
jgi:hypothetical protein